MKLIFLFLALLAFPTTSTYATCSKAQTPNISSLSVLPSTLDSVILDTIGFRDMYDEYTIVRYKIDGQIVQMNVNTKDSKIDLDYILWDTDKNGKLDAVADYDRFGKKFDYHVLAEEVLATDLLEYLVQIQDIAFPSFYDSSAIPKILYKGAEYQPLLNYYK